MWTAGNDLLTSVSVWHGRKPKPQIQLNILQSTIPETLADQTDNLNSSPQTGWTGRPNFCRLFSGLHKSHGAHGSHYPEPAINKWRKEAMFESKHSTVEVYCILLFAFEKGNAMQPRLVQNLSSCLIIPGAGILGTCNHLQL